MRSTAAILTDPPGEKPHTGDRPKRLAPVSEARCRLREERSIGLCEGLIDIVAALFNVSSKELRQPGRTGLEAARVRQIAMYVAHVALQLPMHEIGVGFGRDRTTVLHACHLVEDLRDEVEFDRIVAMTERVALAALGQRGVE